MKIVAILQARLGSTRLPGKSLLPLAGKPMVQNIIERVQRATRLNDVVLAVPLRDAEVLSPLAARSRCWCYAYPGDEADLVGRYLGAAQMADADIIVRVPCDNPCVDPAYLDAAIDGYLQAPLLYHSNTTAWCFETAVDGIGAEVFSLSRLTWLDRISQGHPDWREHPHRYFEHEGLLKLPKAQVKLDVNTQKEYDLIRSVYNQFGHNRFTTAEVLNWLLPQGDPYGHIERVQSS